MERVRHPAFCMRSPSLPPAARNWCVYTWRSLCGLIFGMPASAYCSSFEDLRDAGAGDRAPGPEPQRR